MIQIRKRKRRVSKIMKQKLEMNEGHAYTLRPAIVVPYSLYRSRHILGTWLSSIRSLFSMYSAICPVVTRYTYTASLQASKKTWKMLVAVPCMFLRHARLMPRLSGYRVSSMSARARPIHVYFRRISTKTNKRSSTGAPQFMLVWFGPHQRASSRTWLQQRTPPSSPSVSCTTKCKPRNQSTSTTTMSCACIPHSRLPNLYTKKRPRLALALFVGG
jgi:hypothetical protein